jgi:hypothetical protein
MVAHVGYSVVGRSGGRVTSCAVYTVHVKTRSADFLVEPQNQGRWFVSGLASKPVLTVFSGLASKPVGMVSPSLTSKPVARVSRFGPQNQQLRFDDLCLKITATVSWFGPQNQVGDGLSVAPQNRREDATVLDTRRDLTAYFA